MHVLSLAIVDAEQWVGLIFSTRRRCEQLVLRTNMRKFVRSSCGRILSMLVLGDYTSAYGYGKVRVLVAMTGGPRGKYRLECKQQLGSDEVSSL